MRIVMIVAVEKPMSFDEFVAWLPQDRRYELIDGIVVEMQPTGDHESFSDFLRTQFTLESHRLTLPYSFPSRALLKAPGWNTGYLPDVLVLDKLALVNEPRWQREATITKGSTVKLVVEVVSTNWETDYLELDSEIVANGNNQNTLCYQPQRMAKVAERASCNRARNMAGVLPQRLGQATHTLQ